MQFVEEVRASHILLSVTNPPAVSNFDQVSAHGSAGMLLISLPSSSFGLKCEVICRKYEKCCVCYAVLFFNRILYHFNQ